MANSWSAVAVGAWASGAWLGEIATCKFSGAARDSGSFSAGAINADLPEFAAVPSGATSSSTHFTWSFGSEGVGGWTQANQMAIGEAMWTWLNAIKVLQSSAWRWNEVRVSAINADGTVVNGATVGTITSPLSGTGTQAMPPQIAAVSSLATGGRGPRNRGRLYIPCTQITLAADALIGSSTKTTVNNATRALVNDTNAISGVRGAVVSRVHATYSDIVSVRIGDELDTQRRRRNGRKESFTVLAI